MHARKEILKSVYLLYDVRSQIVHSGRFQVTDTELLEARQYAKQALLTVIQAAPFRDMKDEAELDTWLDDQLLAGEAGDGLRQ